MLFFLYRNNEISADTITVSEPTQTIYQANVPQIGKDGTTLSSYDPNKSLFPIGVYFPNSDTDLSQVIDPAHGFNMAVTFETFVKHDINSVNSILDKIKNSLNPNFKIILNNKGADYFKKTTDNPANPLVQGLPTNPDNSAILDSFTFLNEVQKVDTNNNIFAWYIADEPLAKLGITNDSDIRRSNLWTSFLTFLINERIKKSGVSKPTFLVNTADTTSQNGSWHEFSKLGDIAVMDNYPTNQPKILGTDANKTITSIDPPKHEVSIPKTVLATVKDSNEQKPMWLVVQSYRPNWSRFPTPEEEKAFVYSGIVHGATGIIYYAYDSAGVLRTPELVAANKDHVGISPNPDPSLSTDDQEQSKQLWDTIAGQGGINSQLNQLTPVILSKTSKMDYAISFQGANIATAPIQSILKEYNGKYYLIAVNVDNAQIDGTFGFPEGIVDNISIEVKFENRNLTGTTQQFQDSFAPFGVHVYSWDKKPGTISLLRGLNAVNSTEPLLAKDLQDKGLTVFEFNSQGERNWKKSQAGNVSIEKILPNKGYYIFSPYNQTVTAERTQGDTLGTVIRKGWNLISNSSDSSIRFSSITLPVVKADAKNECLETSCFATTSLSQITSRSYRNIALIKNDQTSDAQQAFKYENIRDSNVSIPPHTNFWLYLFN